MIEPSYVKIYKDLGGNGALIHCLNRWIEKIGTSNIDVPTIKSMTPKLTNCKNCGAILHSNRCEFCGTEYDWQV
jgi:recombinational DNA repair protein RecR